MADRIFEIEFRSVSTGDGAQQLLSDLDKLKQAAQVDQTVTAADPIAPIVKSAQELAQAAPAAGKSVKDMADMVSGASAAGKSVKDMADMVNAAGASTSGSFSGLKGGIESLLSTMRNGGPTIGSFVGALKAAASVGAAGAAAGVGAVVAATSAVAVALVAVTVKASKAIADFILEKEKLRDGVAEFNFDKLENAKLTFAKQIAAMDQMIERVKLYTELANGAVQAQAKLDQSERNMRMARAEAESAKTVAASGNDPAVAAVEAAKLAAIKASLDAEERQSKASDEVTVSKRNHREAVDTLATITKRIADNEQTYERTQFGLGELAKKLTDNVGEQQRLSESTAAIDAEIAKLKEDERDSRRAQLLELMKRGAEMRDAAKAGLEKDRPAEMAASEKVNTTRMEQQQAENNLVVALDQNTAGMTNAGIKYGESAVAIKTSIDALTLQLQQAKADLAVKQGSTGAPASGQEQSAAYNRVQELEAQLNGLKAVQEKALQEVSETTARFGETFISSAKAVQTKAEESAEALKLAGESVVKAGEESTGKINAAAEAVTKDYEAAAGSVSKAADDAQQSSVAAIGRLGSALDQGFGKVASALDKINGRVDQLSTKIDQVSTRSSNAEAKAQQALDQVRNQ